MKLPIYSYIVKIFHKDHSKQYIIKDVMLVIWDTRFHIDDDKESLSSMHVVYSFRQQLSTYIPISFLCSKSYFAVTGITSIFLFPASGGFILDVMFAAAFVHILYFVSFVSYFCFVKSKIHKYCSKKYAKCNYLQVEWNIMPSHKLIVQMYYESTSFQMHASLTTHSFLFLTFLNHL